MVHARLTSAQRAVLRCLLDHMTVKELARELSVAVSTARWHIRRIHAATDTHTLSDLVFWAVEHRDCCIGSPD